MVCVSTYSSIIYTRLPTLFALSFSFSHLLRRDYSRRELKERQRICHAGSYTAVCVAFKKKKRQMGARTSFPLTHASIHT